MDVHRSEDEFSDIERPSTSRASPSDRRMSLSKHKSSSKSKSPPGHRHMSLFDKRKSSRSSKSPSTSYRPASLSKKKRSSSSRSPSPSYRQKSLSKGNGKEQIEYVDLVDDNDTINQSSQINIDLSFMDIEEKVDALDGIAANAARYANKEDNATISKSSHLRMDLFFKDVEKTVNAHEDIASIDSRIAGKEDNATVSKSSQRLVESSFMDVEDRVNALDGIAAIASRYASKGNDTIISKSSLRHVDSSFMNVEERVDALDGIAAIASRYASKDDTNISKSSFRHVDSSFMNIEERVDALDGIAAIASRLASKDDDTIISKSSFRHVDSSFMNIEERVDALDGIAAIASRLASKGDNAIIKKSSKRHVDLSFMDVEDKVDALDGIAAIASRYASKINKDTSKSKGKSKSTKGEKNKDACSSIQSSKCLIRPSKNIVKSKCTNKNQNNYRIPKINESRNINESKDVNKSDGSYKELNHSGESSFWNYSSLEGPSSWDDLRSDISPPRNRHGHNFKNVRLQNRKQPSECIQEKRQLFQNEDLNTWDDLRSYDLSHKRRGSSIPPPQKNKYFSNKSFRDDDLRFSISPRNKNPKYKRPLQYEDVNSWDDFRPKNNPYNRCSSIPPRQKNVYVPNKRGSSICPPQKRAYSPSEEPQNWDDLRSYDPLSSRGKYAPKVSMEKLVPEEESKTREASSLPTLLSVPTCHICKKYFKTKFVFMKHLKFCDAFRTCFSCNKVLKTNANLQQHLTDTGHAKPTSSLETWKYISVKKFKSIFANRDVVEETEFFSENEMAVSEKLKNLKEKSVIKSTKDCSRKSIDKHSNEDDDNENNEEDQYLDCEENDREIEIFLNVQRKSYVDESYFEEKEERNCLDGVAALLSRFKANPSSDVTKEKQKLIENVNIKDKEMEKGTMIEHTISATKDKKEEKQKHVKKANLKVVVAEQNTITKRSKRLSADNLGLNMRRKNKKLIDNVDLSDKKEEQESMLKQSKRLTAKDFFSYEDQFLKEDSVNSKKQESVNEECDSDMQENNDLEITEKSSKDINLQFDICVEENNENKHSKECVNISRSSGASISAPKDNPTFSFVGFDPKEIEIDEDVSESDSCESDGIKDDVLKVSDSECEIVEPSSSNEVRDDNSYMNNLIENDNHESNLKSIDRRDHSSLSKHRKNAKKTVNTDKDGKKLNRQIMKNIDEESDYFVEKVNTLLTYTNLKNKLADGNIKGTNILKCRKKGTTTIVQVTDLIEKCPGCRQQIDITTLVFDLKKGKMSFWCKDCSLLIVKLVKSGQCSNRKEKHNSLMLKVKTSQLNNKKKDKYLTDQELNEDFKIKSINIINKKNRNTKNIKKGSKDGNLLKVGTYEKKNIKQVNTKNRKNEKSNKVVRKRGRPRKNTPVLMGI